MTREVVSAIGELWLLDISLIAIAICAVGSAVEIGRLLREGIRYD